MKVSKINYSPSVFSKTKTTLSKKNTNNYRTIERMPNIYYSPLNFTRKWQEHKSWGAQIDPVTKNVTFKLFSYPDNKSVSVEIKDQNSGEIHSFKMRPSKKNDGIYESGIISSKVAHHNDTYRYIIERSDGTVEAVKDPYSYRQKTLTGESVLYDNSLFQWSDKSWYKSNPERISRLADKDNNLASVSDLKIYEFNTKTLTKDGTFDSAKNELKRIKEYGFNAIEIMPVENTYSFNWGYDGVDKFAPSEHLGGPDALKSLIDYAHSIGLNVIMDMVPNHVGPDGNTLSLAGPYIKGPNAFGDAINFEGENSKYVKDFIVNSAINWIDNYHCDGIRFDMTKFMESDYTMKQISAEINYHFPDAFLIAEDGRSNVRVDGENVYATHDVLHDERVVGELELYEYGEKSDDDAIHNDAIEKIACHDGSVSLARLGYDSEWDFSYFHQLKETLYGNVDLDKLFGAMVQSQNRVKYVMSHDEIGNYDGTRLVAKLMVPMLSLNENIILDEQDTKRASKRAQLTGMSYDESLNTVKSQKVQLVCEKLLKMLLEGKFENYEKSELGFYWLEPVDPKFIEEVLKPLGINPDSGICPEKIQEMYQKSFSLCKNALALTYSTPGPKMVFQGDENLDITPFRFFREFKTIENDKENLFIEKGYDAGKEGLKESTFGNIDYTKYANKKLGQYGNLMQDLNKIAKENPAMTDGHFVECDTIKHYQSKLIATHSVSSDKDNELYTISNFEYCSYPRQDADKYYIRFPKGTWVEILSTDDKKYGGEGYKNYRRIVSDGNTNIPINIGRYSTSIFKKIG